MRTGRAIRRPVQADKLSAWGFTNPSSIQRGHNLQKPDVAANPERKDMIAHAAHAGPRQVQTLLREEPRLGADFASGVMCLVPPWHCWTKEREDEDHHQNERQNPQ